MWWGDDDVIFCVSGVRTNPNTETHRSVLIHPQRWFQKSVCSGTENLSSVWTVGPDTQN